MIFVSVKCESKIDSLRLCRILQIISKFKVQIQLISNKHLNGIKSKQVLLWKCSRCINSRLYFIFKHMDFQTFQRKYLL